MVWLMSLVLAGAAGHAPVTAPITAPPLAHAAPASAEQLLSSAGRRIRSPEPRILKLMTEGARRSRTFANLVKRIHQTDLIVYVETVHDMKGDTVGRILLQTVAGGRRYVRVQIRSMLAGDQIIAVVAHELRHAIEVAEDASVVDDATMTQLYQRIGHLSEGQKGYDTDEARSTGFRVRDELVG